MFSHHRHEPTPSTPALRFLCTQQMQHEATLLTAVLLLVRSMETAFRQHNSNELAAMMNRQVEIAAQIAELNRERARFCESAARWLPRAPDAITLPIAISHLPAVEQAALAAELARIRALAEELAALVRRVSVFLRIHLDAFQRILRDLTNSHQGSGRYGPTGNAEAHVYRPLLQIHG
jgi:flagellar biosynthesis/type III secretory pathway chaperone